MKKYYTVLRGLLVDCNVETTRQLQRALEDETFSVLWVDCCPTDLPTALRQPSHLVVVDLVLPSKSGLQINRAFQMHKPDIPALFLVADKEPSTIVAAFEAGADDVLAKPFAASELAARVRALLRRHSGFQKGRGDEIVCGELRMDPVKHKAWRGFTEISLTSREYALLKYFMLNPNKVLARSQIHKEVWLSKPGRFANIIDVYINYLRKKLEAPPGATRVIETVRGVGYLLNIPEGDPR